MKDLSNIGADRHTAGCGTTVKRAALAFFCFYVFAGLFNGVALQHNIELMRYGTKRDVCLALIRPVAWLSEHSGACHLRTWLDRTFKKTTP